MCAVRHRGWIRSAVDVNPDGAATTTTVVCPPGEKPISGGYELGNRPLNVYAEGRASAGCDIRNAWFISVANPTPTVQTASAVVHSPNATDDVP